MNGVQKAIFPGIVLSSFLIILITQFLSSPQTTVQAESGAPSQSEQANLTQTSEGPESDSNSGCSLGSRYPEKVRRWCDVIESTSAEHGLDPGLIAAVILQESGGDPDAYSRSGAVGLMQVMPRDGIAADFMCQNGPCFASRPSMEELFDPNFNISYGVNMLAGLASKKGDIREALRAYGPMDSGYSYADLVLTINENYRD